MKVSEAAARYGVSTTAIYNRLKGLENKGREENGEISVIGFSVLESSFVPVESIERFERTKKKIEEDSKNDADALNLLKEQFEIQRQDLDEARARIRELEEQQDHEQTVHAEQMAELQARIKTAEDNAQALQQASEILTAKLEIVPELRKQIEALEADKAFLKAQIPPRITDGTERKGFLWRLFGRGSR